MESFSPKAMTAWGYDYESLRTVRPDLIMTSSCLMGQTGPHRLLAGFGTMAAAISGYFHITGWPDRAPCGPFLAYTDYVSPRFLLMAVLAALEHRRPHRRGPVHRPLAGRGLDAPPGAGHPRPHRERPRHGAMWQRRPVHRAARRLPGAGRRRVDRHRRASTTSSGRRCAARSGRHDMASLSLRDRLARRRELDAVVAGWSTTRDGDALMQDLQDAGVAAHVVQNSAGTFADPQLRHRGHFVEVPHDAMGTTWVEGSRLRLVPHADPRRTGRPDPRPAHLAGPHRGARLRRGPRRPAPRDRDLRVTP